MRYCGCFLEGGEFVPPSAPRPGMSKRAVRSIMQDVSGKVYVYRHTQRNPTVYPDLDTALVAIKLRMS